MILNKKGVHFAESSANLTASLLAAYRIMVRNRFNDTELEYLHYAFHRYSPTGRMDKQAFRVYLSAMLHRASYAADVADSDSIPQKDLPPAYYEHLYRGYDFDADGVISFSDYLLYHTAVVHREVDLLVTVTFAMYDVRGDGYITHDEMMTVLESSARMAMHVGISGPPFGYEQSGIPPAAATTHVTAAKIQDACAKEVERLMKFLDVDGDGRVSRSDLMAVSARHPEVLEKLRDLA